MTNQEIKGLSMPDLLQKLQEEQTRYQKLTFGHAVSPLENPMTIRAARKLIARYKTEITARSKQQNNNN